VIIILQEIMLMTIHMYPEIVVQIVQQIEKLVKMDYALAVQAHHGIHIVASTVLHRPAQML
jgi:hypothetical protein